MYISTDILKEIEGKKDDKIVFTIKDYRTTGFDWMFNQIFSGSTTFNARGRIFYNTADNLKEKYIEFSNIKINQVY
jgi:hypothetical protein